MGWDDLSRDDAPLPAWCDKGRDVVLPKSLVEEDCRNPSWLTQLSRKMALLARMGPDFAGGGMTPRELVVPMGLPVGSGLLPPPIR